MQTSFACAAYGGKFKTSERASPLAIYSCSVKTVGRSCGRSATAAAAYRNAELITDHRTGEVHDYRRRSGVDAVVAFAPTGMKPMPAAQLWNAAEAAEVRKNAVVAREVLVALPHELSRRQRHRLVEQITRALVDHYQVAGTAAVHLPDREGDGRNHHAHILMTVRRIDPATGQLGEKTRELDEMRGRGPEEIEWIREMVEVKTNAALEAAGRPERVDRRSLSAQRAAAIAAGLDETADELDRLPTIHEGPTVTAIRRRGGQSHVAQINDFRRAASAERAAVRDDLRQVEAEIHQIEQARARRDAELKHELAELVTGEADQQTADIELLAMRQERQRLEQQRDDLDAPDFYPDCWEQATALHRQRAEAIERCEAWQREHRLMSRLMGVMGMEPGPVRAARKAEARYRASPEVREAVAWQREQARRQAELAEVRQRLADLIERLPPEPEPPQQQAQPHEQHGPAPSPREQLEAGLAALQRHEPELEPDEPKPSRGLGMG